MIKIENLSVLILIIIVMLVGCNESNIDIEEKTFTVESYSMSPDIKLGDILIYEKIENKDDIVTWARSRITDNYKKFGGYGDVILYHPDGDNNISIPHRAMCWVEVEYIGSNKTYSIEEYGINKQNANESLYMPEVGIMTFDNQPMMVNWSQSGFITKGDNPDTNYISDQVGGISNEPIKIEWILGKVTGLK